MSLITAFNSPSTTNGSYNENLAALNIRSAFTRLCLPGTQQAASPAKYFVNVLHDFMLRVAQERATTFEATSGFSLNNPFPNPRMGLVHIKNDETSENHIALILHPDLFFHHVRIMRYRLDFDLSQLLSEYQPEIDPNIIEDRPVATQPLMHALTFAHGAFASHTEDKGPDFINKLLDEMTKLPPAFTRKRTQSHSDYDLRKRNALPTIQIIREDQPEYLELLTQTLDMDTIQFINDIYAPEQKSEDTLITPPINAYDKIRNETKRSAVKQKKNENFVPETVPYMKAYTFLTSCSGDKRKMRYRKSVIQTLGVTGSGIWAPENYLDYLDLDKIDKGDPVFEVMASALDSRLDASDIKNISRHCRIIDNEKAIKKYSPFLKSIDLAFWPINARELKNFDLIISMVQVYGETFGVEPEQALRQWLKNRKTHDALRTKFSWEELLKAKLKSQIKTIEEKSETTYEPTNVLAQAAQKYITDTRNISDMVLDVHRRILRPGILLALRAKGFDVTQTSVLKTIEKKVTPKLWAGMSPSDQMSASSYWHSPLVNISRKRQAISLASSDYSQWQPLFVNSIKLEKKVIAVSLATSEALEEEGDAMKHCVGSYGPNCFEKNYHIISLRTPNGKRLSTLTLQDFFDKNGKRKVKEIYNLSVCDTQPSADAVRAAHALVEKINNGEIIPDWHSIDEIRDEYNVKAIENASGYNILDPSMRQDVLDVYAPCIDKKIMKAGGKSFDGLMRVLGITEIVDDFLAEFDHSQGALVPALPASNDENTIYQPRPTIR